jgi:hypothetical protein
VDGDRNGGVAREKFNIQTAVPNSTTTWWRLPLFLFPSWNLIRRRSILGYYDVVYSVVIRRVSFLESWEWVEYLRAYEGRRIRMMRKTNVFIANG